MLRRCLPSLADSFAAAQGKYAQLMQKHKTGVAFDKELSRLFDKKAIARTDLDPLLTACRKYGLWMHGIVAITNAHRRGLKLEQRWRHDVIHAAPPQHRATVHARLDPVFDADERGVLPSAGPTDTVVPLDGDAPEDVVAVPDQLPDDAPVVTSRLAQLRAARLPAVFDQYYSLQRVVDGPAELAALSSALMKKPATVVRINTAAPSWPIVAMQAARLQGLVPVEWFPASLAWQLDEEAGPTAVGVARHWIESTTRAQLASFQSPSSLLPALALEPQSTDLVLDMCAAPGSKTRHLLDLMAGPAQVQGLVGPSGMLVANETDARRHAALTANVAHRYPHIALHHSDGTMLSPPSGVRFNRVLVDAPCSSEGLLHKNRNLAERWTPALGVKCHEKQLALLRRALSITAVGGRVVYATCTMNPIENEAVVLAALRDGGCVVQRPANVDDILDLGHGLRRWTLPQSAPSTAAPPSEGEDAVANQLVRCRRVLPHKQRDMDAFFFAVLTKTADTAPAPQLAGSQSSRPAALVQRFKGGALPVGPEHPALRDISDLFRIDLAGPALHGTRFLFRTTRGAAPREELLAASATAATLTTGWHELAGCGVMVAWRSLDKTASTSWVLTDQGARLFGPLATARVVRVPLQALRLVLSRGGVSEVALHDVRRLFLNKDAAVAAEHEEWLRQLEGITGPLVLRFAAAEGSVFIPCRAVDRDGSQLALRADSSVAERRSAVALLAREGKAASQPQHEYQGSFQADNSDEGQNILQQAGTGQREFEQEAVRSGTQARRAPVARVPAEQLTEI